MDKKVSLVSCEDYDEERVYQSVLRAVDELGGANKFIQSGQKVAIKANLLMKTTPEKCATTHPSVVGAIGRLCQSMGAEVIIVDSAGGPYNAAYMNSIYKSTGIQDIADKYSFMLNQNFNYVSVENAKGIVGKKFDILQTLYDADVIINACKLKTHAFAGFTNAVKNMFGAIPGLTKVEMHGKYRDINTFCDFLYDIIDYFGDKIVLHVSDAIDAMEGEGPSNGTPRHIGVIMASQDPVSLDLVGARLINADSSKMPTLMKAKSRGLYDNPNCEIVGENIEKFIVKDFLVLEPNIKKPYANYVPQCMQNFVHRVMTQRPKINKKYCRGCGKCYKHCPVNAIAMEEKNGKKVANIDYNKCIKCFCCQELCPFGVIKIKSNVIYRIVHAKRKS